MIINSLRQLKRGSEHLNYGRAVIAAFVQQAAHTLPSGQPVRILDIGFGSSVDLLNAQAALLNCEVRLFGLDSLPPATTPSFIITKQLNIEAERFPFEDGAFEIVIANQTLEHTKELFWICSEVSRVLAPGGGFIVGVPNLASLHNRVLLAFGEQPTCIEPLGPHVRGFTRPGFSRFITTDDFFSVEAVRGSNFYPMPEAVAQLLARWLPDFAVGLFFLCRRTLRPGSFLEVLQTRSYQTEYFTG